MCVCDAVFVQLLPMLMHLFPGCSVSDVLSSSEGRAVRAQLKDTIQAYNSSSHQQRSATWKINRQQGDAGFWLAVGQLAAWIEKKIIL